MKIAYTLSQEDLQQAVREYVAKKTGSDAEGTVEFQTREVRDFADRPLIGCHIVTATFTQK